MALLTLALLTCGSAAFADSHSSPHDILEAYNDNFVPLVCPDQKIDAEMQEKADEVTKKADQLRLILDDSFAAPKFTVAGELADAMQIYRELMAVCAYNLRKSGRTKDLREFKNSILPTK